MGAASFEVTPRFYRRDSDVATGSATAPAAGAAIVTIAAPSLNAGRFKVTCIIGYGATAGLINDMELRRGGTAIATLQILPVVNQQSKAQVFEQVELGSTDNLSINAITGGVAGSVYNATILATHFN